MQVQQTKNATQAINYTQSLAAVQTLLRAGLGAITYLRNLLPEDNFVTSHFTAATNEQSFQLESSQESSYNKRGSGFSIMTLARGYTDEADRLLNYLEYGIFDALEKRYLRSFVFAVYLDNKDPNNVLEAYTFNFKYYTIPGSNMTIPVMSLGKTLQKMTLNREDKTKEDHVAQAIKNGKTPTLKEVKMSVKTLLKTLISAMQKMEFLPRRRFATFKVFYTDETPLDYEPPHFQAGDIEKDKWYFMTHGVDEVPDRYSIGKLNAGHHSVNITVTSITPFLPSSTEHDNDAFGGTVTHAGRMTLTLQEANLSKQQAEKQLEDAGKRNVVWSADCDVDLCDEDAEGEDEVGFVQQEDGTYREICLPHIPIGIRGQEGIINPLPMGGSPEEAQYGGVPESVPTKLQDMAAAAPIRVGFEETQPLFVTPKNKAPRPDPPSNQHLSSSPSDSVSTFSKQSLETNGCLESSDVGMLDLETQPLIELHKFVESIKSFEGSPSASPTVIDNEESDNGLDCECGINIDDDTFLCEGGCKKWFHIWCMGYHSVNDHRIPAKFVCFDCRMQSDASWEIIKLEVYPEMHRTFKELSLFRRAIKTAEQIRTFTLTEFSKIFGSDTTDSARIIKRLEEEGFVSKETTALDDMGMITTSRSKATKVKTKSAKASTATRPRRNLQKSRYGFIFSIQSKAQYKDYFNPNDREVENRLLGITDMLMPKHMNVDVETQTQEETQFAIGTIRRNSIGHPEAGRPLKRVKVSVTAGVDLAE